MTQEHPITPPPELVQQWWDGTHGAFYEFEAVATQAARWGADQQLKLDIEQINQAWQKGADQELEACCEWLVNEGHEYEHVALRDARRPKPSLKKQALETLCSMQIDPCWINGINTNADLMSKYDIIRRALEQLND